MDTQNTEVFYVTGTAVPESLITKVWPNRRLCLEQKNVINNPLVDRSRIILLPLEIRFDKQFGKVMDKDGKEFKYVRRKFPQLTNS